MAANFSPLFIIGTQRSGSNLLRLMLNESAQIAAPHPPHIIKVFQPLLGRYGNLQDTHKFEKLVADVCEFVEKNPVEWEVVPTLEQVLPRCKVPTLIEVMQRVYELVAEAKGAKYWCCKSMANVAFLPELATDLPAAKFLYLYRDARDVALSFTKAVVGEKHVYSIAQQWKQDQQLALDFEVKYPAIPFFKLKYEDFIQNPESSLHQVCDFLGIEYQDRMMEYHRSQESKRTAASGEMWANVVQPVLSQNQQKFLRELSPTQIQIIESVAFQEMSRLGYVLQNNKENLISFPPNQIAEFIQENEQLKKAIRQKISPEELSKRQRQEALVQRIKGGV